MQSRMEKYTEAHEQLGSRSKRNEELYKSISEQELDKYTVKENATVLGDNGASIDVEHIKRILETRYNEAPKRKSIIIPDEKEDTENEVIETKEYDINLILEKAKEQENLDYEKNRFKKLRDTQYDILKDLNIDTTNSKEEKTESKDELMELINTITQKELENRKNEENDPLDLFPDLRGDEDTVVLEGMSTSENNQIVEKDKIVPEEEKEENTFYTTSTVFTQSDFDDFEDLKKEVKGHKVVLIIVTTLVIIGLLVGIFLLLNNFLGINFFKR